jgi:hypothetical protein
MLIGFLAQEKKMTAANRVDNLNFKISEIDIELKEKQFMDIDQEYYRVVKAKPKKHPHVFFDGETGSTESHAD